MLDEITYSGLETSEWGDAHAPTALASASERLLLRDDHKRLGLNVANFIEGLSLRQERHNDRLSSHHEKWATMRSRQDVFDETIADLIGKISVVNDDVVVLLKAVKAQTQTISSLQARVSELENKNNKKFKLF